MAIYGLSKEGEVSSERGHGLSWGWREMRQFGVSKGVCGEEQRVVFQNPGERILGLLRGKLYMWHQPIFDEEGKLIGHHLGWSLLSEEYDQQFREARRDKLVPREA